MCIYIYIYTSSRTATWLASSPAPRAARNITTTTTTNNNNDSNNNNTSNDNKHDNTTTTTTTNHNETTTIKADAYCHEYIDVQSCGWTINHNCAGQIPGKLGLAYDDGSRSTAQIHTYTPVIYDTVYLLLIRCREC